MTACCLFFDYQLRSCITALTLRFRPYVGFAPLLLSLHNSALATSSRVNICFMVVVNRFQYTNTLVGILALAMNHHSDPNNGSPSMYSTGNLLCLTYDMLPEALNGTAVVFLSLRNPNIPPHHPNVCTPTQ